MGSLATTVRALSRLSRILERSCEGLTLPQYRVLALVASGNERATRLAEHLAVAKPTITAVVDGLVDRGLVRRAAVEGDRRSVRLQITAAGHRALIAAEQAMEAALGRVLDRVDDRRAVIAAVTQLDAALDALAADRLAGTAR
jgi:DNA-binding MarR family transcriptional regulator